MISLLLSSSVDQSPLNVLTMKSLKKKINVVLPITHKLLLVTRKLLLFVLLCMPFVIFRFLLLVVVMEES